MNGAYRFEQFAVGASEPPAPQGAAGSITEVNVFCHRQYPLKNPRTPCLQGNEMPVFDKLREQQARGHITPLSLIAVALNSGPRVREKNTQFHPAHRKHVHQPNGMRFD